MTWISNTLNDYSFVYSYYQLYSRLVEGIVVKTQNREDSSKISALPLVFE